MANGLLPTLDSYVWRQRNDRLWTGLPDERLGRLVVHRDEGVDRLLEVGERAENPVLGPPARMAGEPGAGLSVLGGGAVVEDDMDCLIGRTSR